MPVFRPKQSDRFAAQLNSPPLTWISHSVALRNGMIPGSSRCTSAPSDRKSSAPSLRIFRPVLIDSFLQTRSRSASEFRPTCPALSAAVPPLRAPLPVRPAPASRSARSASLGPRVGGGNRQAHPAHHHDVGEIVADVRHFFGSDLGVRQDLLQDRNLLGVALVDVLELALRWRVPPWPGKRAR